jgi:hypothetical protein
VLTLWAAVVAERLGHPPDLALTLGHAVAGSSARAKARSIGIADDKDHTAEKREHELRPAFKPVRLLGRDIRLAATEAGELLADDKGKPADPGAVRRYLTKAFGGRLAEVRAAMEAAAALLPPEDLNRVGFRIYEGFRPEVAPGAEGSGARRTERRGRRGWLVAALAAPAAPVSARSPPRCAALRLGSASAP